MYISKQYNLSIINWLIFPWSALVSLIGIHMRLADRFFVESFNGEQQQKESEVNLMFFF